jgi:D-alanyl-lipoteichoic acid acyltransferase DltB (MBOAT superfamily)
MTELFNNWLFIFPIFFLIYWFSLRWKRINNILLFLFGVLIYSWGNIERGVLLVILMVIDFLLVKHVYPFEGFRKAALITGIFINLNIWLFFMKYPIACCEGSKL